MTNNPLATVDAADAPVADGVDKNRDIERLRAFAVLFVIIAHISWIQSEMAERLWFTLRPWTGVDLFFVISGFVVANAFERDSLRFAAQSGGRMLSVFSFYTKRAARILPTAMFVLAFWWLGWMFFNRSGSWGGGYTGDQVTGLVVSNLLFFSNYGMVFGLVIKQLGWYWSLCVEEHFYLLYPAFRILTPSAVTRTRVLLAVVVVTIFGLRAFTSNATALQQLSHNRFDQLAYGVLLFLAWRHAPSVSETLRDRLAASASARRVATEIMTLFLFAIATLPTFLTAGTDAGAASGAAAMRLTLVVTGFLSLVLVALASFNLDLLSFGVPAVGRALFALGTRSYALYMYHLPAKWTVQELAFRFPRLVAGTMPNGRMIALYLVALALLVEANYRLIERPCVAWGRRRVRRLAIGEPAPSRPRVSGRTVKVIGAAVLTGMVVLAVVLEFRFRAQYETELRPPPGQRTQFIPLSPAAPLKQVVMSLRERGQSAVELALPSSAYMEPDAAHVAVSGLSRHPTVLCRRADGWIAYDSDEYGFNNPLGAHHGPVDVVLLGDDAAAGVCMPDGAAIADRLRARGTRVVSLALPGNGPLLELAALREFGLPLSARTVVWVFAEDSDIADLNGELRQRAFLRYLEPAFSQHLRDKVASVDAAICARLQIPLDESADRSRPAAAGPSSTSLPRMVWGHWFDFPALKRAFAHGAIPDRADNPTAEDAVVAPGLAVPVVAVDAPPIPVLPYLSQALARARDDVAAAGGRLVFVYLPERRHFSDGYEGPEAQVMKLAADLQIPAVDLTGVLADGGDPLRNFEATSQYSAQGMRIIADAIARIASR